MRVRVSNIILLLYTFYRFGGCSSGLIFDSINIPLQHFNHRRATRGLQLT